MTSRPRTEQDEAFTRFCTTGDPAALTRVHDLVAPKLLQLARRVLRSGEGSEDAVQATFLTAIEKASTWDPSRPVERWLTGILVNHIRAMGRRNRRTIDPRRLGARELETRTPDAAASHAELVATFDEELERLPDAWREPLAMRVTEELSASEIAKKLRRPAGTVRSQLARALGRMRTRIAHALAAVVGAVGLGRLARAERTVRLGAIPATGGATAATLGVLLMTKALTAGVVVALVAGTLWMLDDAPTIATRQVELNAPTNVPTAPAPQTPETAAVALPTPGAPNGAVSDTPAPDVASGEAEEAPFYAMPILAIDASGAPVADARVYRHHSGTASEENEFLAHTDASGLATLMLDQIGTPFFIEHEDVGRSLVVSRYDVPEGRPVRVHLLAPARVDVTVIDPFGAPAANTRVSAAVFMTSPDIREFVASGTTVGQAHFASQVTNTMGRVQLLLDAGMTYDVSAYAVEDNAKRTQTKPLTPTPGESLTLELQIAGAFVVSGMVRDAEGLPVTETHIKSWFTDPLAAREAGRPRPPAFGHAARVDEDGSYVNRLWTSGEFIMMAVTNKRDRRSLPIVITVDENQPRHYIDFDFVATTSIEGRVLDAAGMAQVGVRVSALPPFEKPGDDLHFGRDLPHPNLLLGTGTAITDADGSFVLDGLMPDGVFDLKVKDTKITRKGVTAGTKDVLLRESFEASVAWTLNIHAPAGHVVKGQLVSVSSKASDGTITSTPARYVEADNIVEVGDLTLGETVSISVGALTGHRLAPIRNVNGGSALFAPAYDPALAVTELPWTRVDGPRTVDVVLIPSGTLRVEALDESGHPWPHAIINIERLDDHRALRPYAPLDTDEMGVVTFEGLDPGRYRITSMANGKLIESDEQAVILSGATITAQITR